MWPEHQTTQELLDRARHGDDVAVDQLLQRHREALRRMVQMRLDQKIQRRVDVSDILQDVLVEASRRLPAYLDQPTMAFHLWLRQIARDRIIDAHRRHRSSTKRSVDLEAAPVASVGNDAPAGEWLQQLGDPELTPAAATMHRELARRVEQAISQLDDADAEVIIMRHYEALSNQQIAAALGLTEPAASMRYLRAIRRLRAALETVNSADAQGSSSLPGPT